MPQSALPLDGPFHHEETPRKDIASVRAKLARAKYLAAELNQNGRAGSDDAAEAGYSSESRNETLMLANECQAVGESFRSIQADTRETITALRGLERVMATQTPSADTPALRREASAQVLKHLTGSKDGLLTLIRQLVSDARPEIRDAVTEALSGVTDSQTERLINGAQQVPQVAALQQTVQAKDAEVSALKREVEVKKKLAFDYQRSRHQIETNLIAETAKVTNAERQVSRAKAELKRAQDKIGSLEEDLRITNLNKEACEHELDWHRIRADHQISEMNDKIHHLKQQVQDLDKVTIDLEDEKETLASHLVDRDQSLDTLRLEKLALDERLSLNADHAQLKQAEMESKLNTSNSELHTAREAFKDVTQRLEKAEGRLRDSEAKLGAMEQDLAFSKQETQKAEEARSELKKTVSTQTITLKGQADDIERLNNLLGARDETINSQVEQASIFLRRMSLNVESGIWCSVAEGILTDSTVAPAAQIPWPPWRVLPSWSHDEALVVREDDRSVHAVAMDILAIMKVPTAPLDALLSRLQSLQDMLMDTSPLVSTISQLLLESFAGAVGDERLHLMHHVLICQIVGLLHVDAAEPTEVILDPRATTLVSALKAWDPESGASLNMPCSLSYPDVALVGFNRKPSGIVAAIPLNRQLRWIDNAQTSTTLTHIELLSEECGPAVVPLPLDTRERQLWSTAHL
ncbi:hypothetical protein FBULB1_7839 [Fusarium bulbicola]|nr:hypothetical protein FBULB1_7839 [Fusarium bulbicola]